VNTSFAAFCCQSHALLQRKKEKPIPAVLIKNPPKSRNCVPFSKGLTLMMAVVGIHSAKNVIQVTQTIQHVTY
jgi:hypothetical protein